MDGSSFFTPQPLITALHIDHMYFDDVASLMSYVNQISKQYGCPMSACLTGMNRVTQI